MTKQEQRRYHRADHATDAFELLDVSGHRRGCQGDAGRGQDHNRGVPHRKEKADTGRPLAILHQLAGDVVDGCNMVCIHRMSQTEAIGERRRAEQNRLIPEHQQGPNPNSEIGADQQAIHADDSRPQASRAFIESILHQG